MSPNLVRQRYKVVWVMPASRHKALTLCSPISARRSRAAICILGILSLLHCQLLLFLEESNIAAGLNYEVQATLRL